MASANALTLVNRVLSMTGDFSPLTTVVNSPAGLADRIINFMNVTIADIGRLMDMPILSSQLIGTADGINAIYMLSSGGGEASDSIVSLSVNAFPLEEVTIAQLHNYKSQKIGGLAQFYTRGRAPTGELQVEIFPIPSAGLQVVAEAFNNPSELTVSDASTTQLTGVDDIIVLGSLAHIDAYDGQNRGYEKKYEMAKNKLFMHLNRNKQIRITPESYK